MLHVVNYIAPSAIHGIGVFAGEDILAGALIWKFDPEFDRRYTEEQFKNLPDAVREYFKTYGYKNARDGLYYMTVDNDRFMNHHDTPNTRMAEDGSYFATRFIAKGEELTCDYREFDEDYDTYVGAQHSHI